jgi:hypothetical protein
MKVAKVEVSLLAANARSGKFGLYKVSASERYNRCGNTEISEIHNRDVLCESVLI